MREIYQLMAILALVLSTSCNSYINVEYNKTLFINKLNSPPISTDLTPNIGYRGVEHKIILSYSDPDSDQAISCDISSLSNLIETTACSCISGVCSVGVTGITGYTGNVSFSYTVTANSETSNQSNVSFTLNDIGASNTDEWVHIPADAGGMGLSDFYVMKYEAKAWNDGNTNSTIDSGEIDTDGRSVAIGTHKPVSVPENQPWREINANNSATECESIGSNYHLISNSEWIAIARDIENVDSNWTGGVTGAGCLFRGNSAETTCGYDSVTDPDSGTGRNPRAKHLLSNGQEIFDFSGNVAEWTDWDSTTVGFQLGPTTCPLIGYEELPDVNCVALASAEYDTANGTYDSTQGVGSFFAGSGGAALRGHSWISSTRAGIFSLALSYSPTYSSNGTGFRCVYRP